jgi:hypothetical protein
MVVGFYCEDDQSYDFGGPRGGLRGTGFALECARDDRGERRECGPSRLPRCIVVSSGLVRISSPPSGSIIVLSGARNGFYTLCAINVTTLITSKASVMYGVGAQHVGWKGRIVACDLCKDRPVETLHPTRVLRWERDL